MSSARYDRIGIGYSEYRRADARIASQIVKGLGSSRTLLNIGAGAGSYEPRDRHVVAVEPSAEMLRQRTGTAASAIRASAEHPRHHCVSPAGDQARGAQRGRAGRYHLMERKWHIRRGRI